MEVSGTSKFPGQEWLFQLLQHDFFQPCNCSLGKGCNFYCSDCLGNPFCKSCKPTHEGHSILQIRKTSRRDSIHIEDLNYLLDISGIQRVMINGAKAIYLKPKSKNQHNGSGRRNNSSSENRCECCTAKLLQGNYRFCSLYCKSFNANVSDGDDENHNSSDSITENGDSRRSEEKSLLVKKRKGNPRRSPLY
ncbi:protein RGF1 INDUCIBLE TRANSCRIPTION FACTOR 1-like [Macadamia integrifolia]|uniref:protein RGF1 INDUCIBLE TRANSCRIPTION FACTOR 1-like n=1 Tax=Macadamia integrifolia TaxID=60698 RepID=UPI001C4F735D|nr:protein RGF1 INDUCIBLE TRANSCRIPTION FACTOR 1-like [Macadamia integrifolia]